jgi:adenylate kinase
MSKLSEFPVLDTLRTLGEQTLAPSIRLWLILSPPFTAIGTIAVALSRVIGLGYFNVGDLLQQEIKDRTESGNIAREYLRRERPVPTELVLSVTFMHVLKWRIETGRDAIIQGLPRTLEEAQLLDELLPPEVALGLDASDDELLARAQRRQECVNQRCGALYSWSFAAQPSACLHCGSHLGTLLGQGDDASRETLARFRAGRGTLSEHYQGRLRVVHAGNDTRETDLVTTLQELLNPTALRPEDPAGIGDNPTTA